MEEQPDIIYYEEQKFAPWLLLLILFVIVFSVAAVVFAIKTESQKQNPPDRGELISLIGFGIVLPFAICALLFVFKLQTQVRPDGLYVRLFPLHIRFIKFTPEDILEAYARTYRPLWEYGGWGIRYSLRSGKAYNTRGNEGLQLVLANGKKLLIGSQKAQELENAIKSIMRN